MTATATDYALLRLSEAAKLLACVKGTLYTLMDRGDLEYVRVGADRRIPRQAIVDYIAKNTSKVATRQAKQKGTI